MSIDTALQRCFDTWNRSDPARGVAARTDLFTDDTATVLSLLGRQAQMTPAEALT